MTAAPIALPLRIGARTLVRFSRRVQRVALSLEDALAGAVPPLTPLAAGEQGYLVTSLPEAVALPTGDLLVEVRQRYPRHYVDLAMGEATWRAGLSANTRAQLRRKSKRVAAAGGTVRAYRTPAELAAFHPAARAVSARTYQERLLDAGLPADPASLLALAEADRVRAWLLWMDGAAIAYLCCTGDGETLRYDHVGHDPAAGEWAPGTVLQAAALCDLFDEGRWARFDFTEGDGQHKRQFASASVACLDLLLLRPTPINRALIAALGGWERVLDWAKRNDRLRALGRKLRR